ncbi:MAG: hypothetical protein ACLFMQ_05615 [Desulfohalobiaceae bacterium]
MQTDWYSLQKLEIDQPGSITATAVVPSASPWFSGHFPGDPVLPAIAQLGIVFDILQKASEGTLTPQAVQRIKYRRIIRPDEALNITLDQKEDKPGCYSFQIVVAEEVACKGWILTNVVK